ncbi:hypothetical protein C8R48DRAFT_676069 [Suillus tomentosus]|nr:hypothetical protein C8R48DRAFT_676069 [Suillus tomentosus]
MVSVHVKCINGQWTSCDANPELRKNFVKNVAFKVSNPSKSRFPPTHETKLRWKKIIGRPNPSNSPAPDEPESTCQRKEGRISDKTCALVSMNVLVNSSHQGRSEAPVSFSPISSLLPAKRGARQAIHFPESSLACSPTSLEARENNWQWTRKGWTGDEESAKNQISKESNDCYYDGGADLLANFGSHARTQPLYLFFSAEDSNESDLRLPGQV